MNFRVTILFFGILLGLLWIFGLILASRTSALDPDFVLPKFAKGVKPDITAVEITKDGKPYCVFTNVKDEWRLKLEGQAQEVRADEMEVNQLVDEIRNARHSNNETDVNRNLSAWGLASPKMIVTIKDSKGGEWRLRVGKESEDRAYAYVNSSDRPDDVFAVKRSALSKVFFDDINKFRSRRLLTATAANTRRIDLVENRDDKQTSLALRKIKDKNWWFIKPALGPADLENIATPKSDAKLEDKFDQGARSLLAEITSLRVEDFESIIGGSMTVDEKKPLLRIELEFDPVPQFGKEDKSKGPKTEVLLIGGKVRDKDQYYARMADDNSVVLISSKQVDPVLALIKDPMPLRSRDISFFEIDTIDAVEILRGKEDFAKLFKGKDDWKVFSSDGDPKRANGAAITGGAGLLSAIQGRQAIKDFPDADTPEKLKALEAKFAPDKVEAKVIVYADSLQPPAEKKEAKKDDKADEKKADADKKDQKAEGKKGDADKKDQKPDEKKDEPTNGANQKDEKKDEKLQDKKDDQKGAADKKGDQKEAAHKKEEKQENKTPPKFKEGVKPVVTLSFVKVDKDNVLVKRELAAEEPKAADDKDKKDTSEPTVTYFNLPTSAFEKIVPRDMALAFFDANIKTFAPVDAVKLELQRAPTKDRDKLMETFLLELKPKEKEKAKDDAPKKDESKDSKKDEQAKKDEAKKNDEAKKQDEPKKDTQDADKKKPDDVKMEWKLLEPRDFAGKGEIEVNELQRVLAELADIRAVRWVRKATKETLEHYLLDERHWNVRVSVTPKKKDTDKEEPKPFVLRLGDASTGDTDKGAVFAYQEGTDYIFLVEKGLDKLLKDAEFRDRHVLKFDPTKVKEFRVFVTTADKEVRKPVFERGPDKSWKDKKEVLGFKIDNRRVEDLLDKLSDLQVVRYLNVAKGEIPKDYELGDAAPLKFEVLMDDDKTVHTITVGAASEKIGPYYAQSSAMPGLVFLLSRDPYSELMGKVTYFRKD